MKTTNEKTTMKTETGKTASAYGTCCTVWVLALMGCLAVPSVFAQCSLVPFQPPVGQIIFPVPLDTGTPKTLNGFTLTRQVLTNPDRIRYTVDRPAPQNDVPFERPRFLAAAGTTGSDDFNIFATFIGTHGVLFRVIDRNDTSVHLEAIFFDLSQTSPVEQNLYTQHPGNYIRQTDNPLPSFAQNADGSCLFTMVGLNRTTSPDIFELSVFRTDTGALLCSMPPRDRQLGDIFNIVGAEILDNPPAGVSDTVRITCLTDNSGLIAQICPLPVSDLAVTPQPLTFGPIVNTETQERTVTFSNSGQDPVQVTALGSSARFAPINFTGFTLQGGGSTTRMIRFTPGGANGPFDENLPITRCPAVGAAVVRCTGSATTPLPTVSITANDDSTASEPGTDTGRFTLTRTGNTSDPLTVNLQRSGTATSGVDYNTLPTMRTIPVGSPSVTITVTPLDDAKDEFDQTVILRVATGTGYNVGTPNTATVTILDNDPLPFLTIAGTTVLEGDPKKPGPNAVFTVTLSAASEKTVTVSYNTLFGTATGGSACGSGIDFVFRNGTLTFQPGATSLSVSNTVCSDFVREFGENYGVILSQPVNAIFNTIGVIIGATATILDNDGITGSFDLTPSDQRVAVHERFNYAFTWTVPEPLNWHDLEFLQLRIRDGDDTILSVLFDEASQTFVLLNEATGQFGDAGLAGKPKRLQTPEATLYLADTTVVGSGPTGPSVTLNLSLSFKPQAAGRTFVVEVAATDDLGNQDNFTQAGTLTVSEK